MRECRVNPTGMSDDELKTISILRDIDHMVNEWGSGQRLD